MAISSNGMPTKTQITAVINKIIQRQDKPITLEDIQKEFPGSYKTKPEMLAEQEKIFLHCHVYPFQMTGAERLNMVADEHGNYYMGVVLRN